MDLLQRPPFVSGDGWLAVPLTAADAPALQSFFDANPLYSETVNGRPFGPDEALQEITEAPPYPHQGLHALAVLSPADGSWLGFVSLVDDLIAPGVQHIGLFVMATAEHGSGVATAVHAALVQRARQQGRRWMRLGVVVGNARAERFWTRLGYEEVRQRHNLPYEGASRSVRVLVKPLSGAALAEERDDYLSRVARDRPDSP